MAAEGPGMPWMDHSSNKLVIIKVIRLRVSEYYLLSPSPNTLCLEPCGASNSAPKEAEWKVMWSGSYAICNLMSIHGRVITIQARPGWFFPSYRLKLEPWPVLDASASWHLLFFAQIRGCKYFQAKIKPIQDPRNSLEFDGVKLGIFWDLPPGQLRGWTVEVVDDQNSTVNDRHRDTVLQNPQSEQLGQPQMQPQPVLQAQAQLQPQSVLHSQSQQRPVFINLVNGSGSQNMGGNYHNSGHNSNASGTQNNGGIELTDIAKVLLGYVNKS